MTIVFLIIMFQSDFTLDPNRVDDNQCMEKSLRSTFSNARYKYHVKFKEAQNVEEAKANVPSGLSKDRWHRLCDLFNHKKWKVNLYKLNFQTI